MPLLAKPDETLIQHTENALKVFKSIKDAYPEVPEICGVSDFWEHLFYSLFLHDFGKAAIGFQEYLSGGKSWRYRHEILSASFINALKDIYPKETLQSIGLCIVTHHKDINELVAYDTYCSNVNKESFLEKLGELKFNFDELIRYFDFIPDLSKRYLGYELPIPIKITCDDLTNPFEEIIYDFQDDVYDKNYGPLQGKYGLFLKGFMNACDHLASGGHYEILNAVENRKLFNFKKYSR